MGERRGVYRVLVGKPEGKCHLGEPGVDGRIILKWMCQEVGCGSMGWIELAQDRDCLWAIMNAVMNLRISIKRREFSLTSCKPVSFSRTALLYGVSK
jgi:hypothetical protein